jgi:L-iditol 2-dehydrogenase
MKAVIRTGPGLAGPVQVTAPAAGPGELLLDLVACGLCGTDLAKIFDPDPRLPQPRLGHELVGTVRADGPGVDGFRPGQRLVVAHHVPCGECRACRRGAETMCQQFKATHLDPCGFAEIIRVPALHARHTALPLPPGVTDEVGTFVEPLACALRAVKRSDPLPGDRFAVFGAGAMGILIGQALRDRSVEPIAIDVSPQRVELAKSFGLSAGPAEDLDGAILTAVNAATLQAAIRGVRPGGRINLFAGPAGDRSLPIDLDDLYRRELALSSTYSSTPVELREALALLESGRVGVTRLVTHRLPLDRFAEGVELQRSGRAVKVVFTP